MVKNFAFLLLWLAVGVKSVLFSQEIKIFTTSDFDLHGNVKSCLVSTDYGKEEYDFDKKGRLQKLVTRYSDHDYDITYYKYRGDELVEKRVENYRDNSFDKNTSLANFYEIDSTGPQRKITEKIISYEKQFLERNEYLYDSINNLSKIIRTDADGVDETLIKIDSVKGETTRSYMLNGVVQKSIRTSERKASNDSIHRVELTKKFLSGIPHTAKEDVFDTRNQLVSSTEYVYDEQKAQLVPEKSVQYTYDDTGALSKTESKIGNGTITKSYIYQFDGRPEGNWIKQIITPDNTYKTRKIAYYEKEAKEELTPEE